MFVSFCWPGPSHVKVLYGGTELFDDEVRHTFHNDMMLAVISGVCITVLVYVLTSFSGTVLPHPYFIGANISESLNCFLEEYECL